MRLRPGALALDPLSFISVATLGVMLAILWRLSPEPPRMWPPRVASIRLFALTAMTAVPWLIHGLGMAANGRAGLPPDAQAGRPQAGGWAGVVALALLVVLLGLLAATKTRGWRIPAISAAAASFVFGLVSILNPDAPGSPGAIWGALAIGWSVARAPSSSRPEISNDHKSAPRLRFAPRAIRGARRRLRDCFVAD